MDVYKVCCIKVRFTYSEMGSMMVKTVRGKAGSCEAISTSKLHFGNIIMYSSSLPTASKGISD